MRIKNGSIVDTLNALLEQAEDQRVKATKEETEGKNKFNMLKQSLTAEIQCHAEAPCRKIVLQEFKDVLFHCLLL